MTISNGLHLCALKLVALNGRGSTSFLACKAYSKHTFSIDLGSHANRIISINFLFNFENTTECGTFQWSASN
jgi:hypothetical protein